MVVSVVIPCYNASALLRRCLDSVLSQTYEGTVEIIVVDDGSTDGSADILEKEYSSDITCIKQQNKGASAARNLGLFSSHGDVVAFLDADDYWYPDFLCKTVRFLEEHTELVAVSVAQRHITPSGESIVPVWCSENTDLADIVIEDFFAFWAKNNHVCTGSVLMRTEVARKVGGQRESLIVCEDLEFWACLGLQGSWGMIPDILFVSDGSQVTRSTGWLTKMQRRWNAAPSVADWQQRHRNHAGISGSGYNMLLSRIASILAYCHILAGKAALARQEVIQYMQPYPLSKKMRLIVFFAKCSVAWWMWCKYVIYKEYHRSI